MYLEYAMSKMQACRCLSSVCQLRATDRSCRCSFQVGDRQVLARLFGNTIEAE